MSQAFGRLVNYRRLSSLACDNNSKDHRHRDCHGEKY